MDQRWRGFQFSPQLPPKEDELINVSEPLCDKAARISKASEKRLRPDQFCRDARGDQTIQHHHGEAMHAVLVIWRVVTDQQNHCFDRLEQRNDEDDRRKPNGVLRFAAWLARFLEGRQVEARFRRLHFAPPRLNL